MVVNVQNFSIEQIADSGQCFRINRTKDGRYAVVAYGKLIVIKQIAEDKIDVSCSEEEWLEVWCDYFDLGYDYSKVVNQLENGDDAFLKKAVAYGRGIRILRQEPFEALISFIISQRKNIPAIKSCIEKLCLRYGERRIEEGIVYYTFPTPRELASASEEDLMQTGLGYRVSYVKSAAINLVKGLLNLEQLKTVSYSTAINRLMQLYGVGIKVANCVALFGLHKIEAFPIDVWIQRIIDAKYKGRFDEQQYNGYAGIVQQYMYYYVINNGL